jgi:hypothetical protein
MIFTQIFNQRAINCYFAHWGAFGMFGSDNYYIRGYVTEYENGYKTVVGGENNKGDDRIYAYLLDKDNKLVDEQREYL